MQNLTVSEINLYPIKSCAGLSLTDAMVLPTGITHDRRWMLIRESGLALTQRDLPRMALIKVEVCEVEGETQVSLGAPDMEPLVFTANVCDGERLEAVVWGDRCQAIDQGARVSDWFSKFLKTSCRLVEMAPDFSRLVDPERSITPVDETYFADGFPVLLISQEALTDLNSRLTSPISMNRFRPNIVVEGCTAFEEDEWDRVKVGEVEFAVVKPCSRCMVTTIEQSTAVAGVEPLKTLARYRSQDGKVMFGQNLIPINSGRIKLQDQVQVLSRKTSSSS